MRTTVSGSSRIAFLTSSFHAGRSYLQASNCSSNDLDIEAQISTIWVKSMSSSFSEHHNLPLSHFILPLFYVLKAVARP